MRKLHYSMFWLCSIKEQFVYSLSSIKCLTLFKYPTFLILCHNRIYWCKFHDGNSYLTRSLGASTAKSPGTSTGGRGCWVIGPCLEESCEGSGGDQAGGMLVAFEAFWWWRKYQMIAARAMRNAQPSPTPTPIPTFVCGAIPASSHWPEDPVGVVRHAWVGEAPVAVGRMFDVFIDVVEGSLVVVASFVRMLNLWQMK